jgi:hypothetical protein
MSNAANTRESKMEIKAEDLMNLKTWQTDNMCEGRARCILMLMDDPRDLAKLAHQGRLTPPQALEAISELLLTEDESGRVAFDIANRLWREGVEPSGRTISEVAGSVCKETRGKDGKWGWSWYAAIGAALAVLR